MKRTKFFAGAIALTLAMGLALASCSNDDDDNNNTDTGTTDTDNTAEALESAAFNLLRSVCDLSRYDENAEDEDGDGNWSGIETLPANWQNATYTIDEGAVIGEDTATVYSIPCYDADDALEFFSELIGINLSEDDLTGGTYTWSYTGLGTLTFTKDTTTGDSLFATIDFEVPVLKDTLTQLKFVDSETFEAANSQNSYKGKPYFGAGDIIKRNKDETLWMCVRPAGGPLQKDKSYWVCLNPDEKNLVTEKEETIQTKKWTFAKNLMSLKTAKAAYHTFSCANFNLYDCAGYENAQNVYKNLRDGAGENGMKIDLYAMATGYDLETYLGGYEFCFAYGSYTKDKKRVTSGKNQNAYTQYVQPFFIGKSSANGSKVKEEIQTVRTDTKTMYSATDNYDGKYALAVNVYDSTPNLFNFNRFFHTVTEGAGLYTKSSLYRADYADAVSYYKLNSNKNPDRYFVFFSPELMIKDNKGTASNAVNPLGSKYTVLYRSADSLGDDKVWDWWASLAATERYVDGKKTDFASENK